MSVHAEKTGIGGPRASDFRVQRPRHARLRCGGLLLPALSLDERQQRQSCETRALVAAHAGVCGPCSRARRNRATHRTRAESPPVNGRLEQFSPARSLLGNHRDDDGVRRSEFVVGGIACHDAHAGGRGIRRIVRPGHSGMFPCFLGGRLARLPLRARSALMIATRVAAGSMMPSSSPRSAARNGLATL